jgi:hypothetical protein
VTNNSADFTNITVGQVTDHVTNHVTVHVTDYVTLHLINVGLPIEAETRLASIGCLFVFTAMNRYTNSVFRTRLESY